MTLSSPSFLASCFFSTCVREEEGKKNQSSMAAVEDEDDDGGSAIGFKASEAEALRASSRACFIVAIM